MHVRKRSSSSASTGHRTFCVAKFSKRESCHPADAEGKVGFVDCGLGETAKRSPQQFVIGTMGTGHTTPPRSRSDLPESEHDRVNVVIPFIYAAPTDSYKDVTHCRKIGRASRQLLVNCIETFPPSLFLRRAITHTQSKTAAVAAWTLACRHFHTHGGRRVALSCGGISRPMKGHS
jgi:hypothetical protein